MYNIVSTINNNEFDEDVITQQLINHDEESNSNANANVTDDELKERYMNLINEKQAGTGINRKISNEDEICFIGRVAIMGLI